MATSRLPIAFALATAACSSHHATPASPSPTGAPRVVIDHVRVFDGTAVVADGRVVIAGDVIEAAGPSAAVALPAGATVVDGRGKTLLPGRIDAHTHVWEAEKLAQALAFGVTTELDMMSSPAAIAALKKKTADDATLADLRSAGNPVTVKGGHGTEYGIPVATLDGDASAADFVKARVAEGSDYIKIISEDRGGKWPTLTAQQVAAAVAAAHAEHRLAVVHVSARKRAEEAVAGGADGLAHVWIDGADPALIAAMRERGTFVIPTLTVWLGMCPQSGGRRLADDPAVVEALPVADAAMLRGGFPVPKACTDAIPTVRTLHDAGIRLLAGTDAANPGTAHGASLHGELALLVEAGLTPVEALAAATSRTADTFGLADRGRIAAGKRADLLLVDGDPTTDIAATRRIAGVWKRGVRLDRAAYLASLKAARDAAATAALAEAISDFDDGTPSSAFGTWQAVSDRMMGGPSSVDIAVVDGGAAGTAKALDVRGQAASGAPIVFAGATLPAGKQASATVDLTAKKELVFWAKGDGQTYTVWLLSAATMGHSPAATFTAGPTWQEIHLPFDDFHAESRSDLLGIFFGATAPGAFAFQLDGVRLR